MITEQPAAAAAPAAAPPSPYDTRLATRITGGVDLRLRLAALVRRVPLNQFLNETLDQALPPVAELAEQVQGGAPDEH